MRKGKFNLKSRLCYFIFFFRKCVYMVNIERRILRELCKRVIINFLFTINFVERNIYVFPVKTQRIRYTQNIC